MRLIIPMNQTHKEAAEWNRTHRKAMEETIIQMILTDPNPIETLLAELSDGALRGFILRRGDLKK